MIDFLRGPTIDLFYIGGSLHLSICDKKGKTIGWPSHEPNRKQYNKLKKTGLKDAQIARVMQVPTTTLYSWIAKWEDEERITTNKNIK